MRKEDLIELGLSEEDAKKVAEASNEELKLYIPKTRFDEVNTSKKQLETDIAERDKQLETLKNSKEDVNSLKDTIAKLQDENKTSKEKHDAEIREIKIANALDKALGNDGAKAKNIMAVKPFLDLDNVELLEDDTIKDLDKQIKSLKEGESTSFLFNSEETAPSLKGVKPGEGNTKSTPKDTSQMTYSELCEHMASGNQI